MKIKIIKCYFPSLWYSNLIGQTFNVTYNNQFGIHDYEVTDGAHRGKLISKEDCQLIDILEDDDLKEVSTLFDKFNQPIVFNLQFIQDYTKLANGILFGSRIYNSNKVNDSNDYDFVMPLEHAINLKHKLIKQNIEVTDSLYYISGFYFKSVDNLHINITGCKIDEINAWIIASNMMKQADNKLINKDYAQILFESILAILKKATL